MGLPIPNEASREAMARLQQIAQDLAVVVSTMEAPLPPEQYEKADGRAPRGDGTVPLKAPDPRRIASLAQRVYQARRNRDLEFGDSGLFGEPAWDLLLDLFVAESEGKRLPVTSACIGAAVPTTTALRWLNILESRHLVQRENDPNDARRIHVRITEDGFARMTRYFIGLDAVLNMEARRF